MRCIGNAILVALRGTRISSTLAAVAPLSPLPYSSERRFEEMLSRKKKMSYFLVGLVVNWSKRFFLFWPQKKLPALDTGDNHTGKISSISSSRILYPSLLIAGLYLRYTPTKRTILKVFFIVMFTS